MAPHGYVSLCGVLNVQSQKLPGRIASRFYQVTHGHYQEVFGDFVHTKLSETHTYEYQLFNLQGERLLQSRRDTGQGAAAVGEAGKPS